jgi:hypothetical protein
MVLGEGECARKAPQELLGAGLPMLAEGEKEMLTATSLSNVIVGGKWGNAVSIKFTAKTSAPLAAVRLYWITGNPPGKTGYAAGKGGTYTYELCSDLNGAPSLGLTLAEVIVPQPTENGRGGFPLVCFSPVLLLEGKTYHIVIRNTDPQPTLNWASVDFLINAAVPNQTPDVQILVSAQGVPWEPVDKGTLLGSPVALFYADGTVQSYPWYQIGPNGALMAGTEYGFPSTP